MPKQSWIRRSFLAVLAGVVVPLLGACNGQTTSATDPTAVVDDAQRRVIVSQRFADVEPSGLRVVDFALSRPGVLAVRLNWTDPNNSVTAVITRAGCADGRGIVDSCRVRGETPRRQQDTESTFSYPEAAGAYRLWLHNDGPGTESLLVTVELTPDAT